MTCDYGFIRLVGITGLLTILCNIPHAGGYLAVDKNGIPYKWNMPITVRFDQGPLGDYTKPEADIFTENALAAWTPTNVSGANVVINRGLDLEKDYGNGDGNPEPLIDIATYETDGITPIIYDQTSLVTQHFLGTGVTGVVGFAGVTVPADLEPGPLTDGIVVMNGAFFKKAQPGSFAALTEEELKGAIIHEIGHLLNLDHSVVNAAFGDNTINPNPDYIGFPTMYPIVNSGISTLEFDDISWISSLYPADGSALSGKISGFVKNDSLSMLNGINIVAHNIDNPSQAISCVTGFIDPTPDTTPTGYYELPKLPIGTNWVVSNNPVSASFVGGSRVGPVTVPIDPPGPAEYLNTVDRESNNDDAAHSSTFKIPSDSNNHIENINLIFNTMTTQTIARIDNGGQAQNAQVLTPYPGVPLKISGTLNPNKSNKENLVISMFMDVPEIGEWFVIDPPAGVELNQLFLDNSHNLDYWVAVYTNEDGLGSILGGGDYYINPLLTSYPFTLNQTMLDLLNTLAPGTDWQGLFAQMASPKKRLDTHMDTLVSGDGPFKGKIFIGVSAPANVTTPVPFSLTVVCKTSDRDYVAVSNTTSPAIDPDTQLTINGTGFKNVPFSPIVTFSKPGLSVSNVQYLNDKQLLISMVKSQDYVPGGFTDITVKNRDESGGFSGTLHNQKVLGDSGLSWELY